MDSQKAKIAAQEIVVNKLKAEMSALYYDVRVGPDTSREEEAAIEAVCWAKEEEYIAAKHILTMMRIELMHMNNKVR